MNENFKDLVLEKLFYSIALVIFVWKFGSPLIMSIINSVADSILAKGQKPNSKKDYNKKFDQLVTKYKNDLSFSQRINNTPQLGAPVPIPHLLQQYLEQVKTTDRNLYNDLLQIEQIYRRIGLGKTNDIFKNLAKNLTDDQYIFESQHVYEAIETFQMDNLFAKFSTPPTLKIFLETIWKHALCIIIYEFISLKKISNFKIHFNKEVKIEDAISALKLELLKGTNAQNVNEKAFQALPYKSQKSLIQKYIDNLILKKEDILKSIIDLGNMHTLIQELPLFDKSQDPIKWAQTILNTQEIKIDKKEARRYLKKYHPDSFAKYRNNPKIQEVAHHNFLIIKKALEILS